MSTKTSIKRIALVAAAALTLGGFSAVSASAATYPGAAISVAGGANTVTDSTTFTGQSAATATTGAYVLDTITSNAADKVYTITSTGVGTISIASPGTTFPAQSVADSATSQYAVNSTTSVSWYTGTAPGTGAVFNGTATLKFAVYSAVAGTQTITIAGNSSAAVTQTITWGAAPTVSATNTKIVLEGNTGAAALKADSATVSIDSTTAVSKTAGTPRAGIFVILKNDQVTPAGVAGESLTASISGPGLLAGTNNAGTTWGTLATSASSTTDSNGVAVFQISGSGSSGTGTITITWTKSDGTVVTLGTKTITFYSATIAALTATVNYKSIPLAAVTGYTYAGSLGATEITTASTSTTGGKVAVCVVAADSNGNAIPGAATVDVTSSKTTVATVSAAASYDATTKCYYAVITPVAQGTTTLTFVDDASGAIKATADITVAKAVVKTVTSAAGATSYDIATAATMTISPLDSAGAAVPDGTYTGFFKTGYAPTANIGLQGFAPTETLTVSGGVQTYKFYAPVTAGTPVTIAGGTLNGTAGSTTAGASFQDYTLNAAVVGAASFTTTGSNDSGSLAYDAASAATDAANNAYEEAQNATQAASDALAAVKALAVQVKALIALVNKIKAKLKA